MNTNVNARTEDELPCLYSLANNPGMDDLKTKIAAALDRALAKANGGRGMSGAELGRRSGVPQPTISRTLSAKSVPETHNLAKMAIALQGTGFAEELAVLIPGFGGADMQIRPSSYTNGNVEVPESLPNVGPGPAIRGEVPLISWVQAGEYQSAVDNYAPGCGAEMIPTTIPVKRHTYALTVKGDSMTNPNGWPSFPEGMVIIVEPEFDALPGDFVIVKNGAEEATFKQLVQDGADWYLKPLNPRYPIKAMTGDLRVVGVVRGYGGLLR